jgi:hypothetical protein
MQTYWLSGAKEAYAQYAAILESNSEVTDSDMLPDYHTTMYEGNEQKRSISSGINRLTSAFDQCPFSSMQRGSFI